VRDFYRDHHCHTPLFLEIPREFLDYLSDGRTSAADDPSFLYELAHYEWVELALAVDEQQPGDVPARPPGRPAAGRAGAVALAWPLAYRYPVHRISADWQPAARPGSRRSTWRAAIATTAWNSCT